MTPWQISLQNLDPPPLPPAADLWMQANEHKAKRRPSVRPTLQTIREQSDRIIRMLADGEMTTAAIVAHMGDMHESMVMRRIDRLHEDDRIVRRIVVGKTIPYRTHWWRLP